tara:strand:- start:656 stop:799 length:144 start_codon:yes stop_codon:yes gene_type:complete
MSQQMGQRDLSRYLKVRKARERRREREQIRFYNCDLDKEREETIVYI